MAEPRIAAALLALALLLPAAAQAAEVADDPALDARVTAVASELRCLVCQNQTIAESHAGLAVDLRNQVREMLRAGQSRDQILGYMTARYGAFVRYRPPLEMRTALLWFGPAMLLAAGLAALRRALVQRARMAPEAFEPDEPGEPDGVTAPPSRRPPA